jgi:hypothetical protein
MKFIIYTPTPGNPSPLDCIITIPKREPATLARYRGENLDDSSLWHRQTFKSCAVSVSDFEATVDLEFETCDHLKVRP